MFVHDTPGLAKFDLRRSHVAENEVDILFERIMHKNLTLSQYLGITCMNSSQHYDEEVKKKWQKILYDAKSTSAHHLSVLVTNKKLECTQTNHSALIKLICKNQKNQSLSKVIKSGFIVSVQKVCQWTDEMRRFSVFVIKVCYWFGCFMYMYFLGMPRA